MSVEFQKEINVQTSTRGDYRSFLQGLRVQLGVRSSHNIPALAVQQEPPTRFFDMVIKTNTQSVRFRLRMDNLYLIGYQMKDGKWFEFNNKTGVNLIKEPNTKFLGFDGNYNTLARVAKKGWEEIRVGFYNVGYGINQLAISTDGETRALYLIVVVMMFCESTRLIPIYDYMAESFNNSHGTNDYDYDNSSYRRKEPQIEPWILDLVRAWSSFSAALLSRDAYPWESFQLRTNVVRLPPNNRKITNISEATEILGILLGLCFTPRGQPRLMTEQCFFGLPLVQVFSVRIDNIDGKDPGQLYGTITVNDGLNIEYLYNRTSNEPESIKPGQNASLIGPSQSILAFGQVTIKLLLSAGIINKDISWDACVDPIVYDRPISQKLDDTRGSVTVNYAVLKNATAARITIILEGGGSTSNVYGQVSARYNIWNDDPNATSLLFNRSSNDYVSVMRQQNIPLSRSVVAVPLNSSLIVTVSLDGYNRLSRDDEIAKGTVEFPAEMSGTNNKQIQGKDGSYVAVRVDWTCQI